MLLTLGITVPAMAQAQQKQEQQELVDSTVKDALEAFSDTTMEAVDSAISRNINIVDDWDDDEDAGPIFKKFMREVNANGLVGMFFAMMVVLVIFVISPLVIFGLLLYFIFRNRRQKMRLAEMAMQNGQPIPDQLLKEPDFGDTATYQSGMRQLFLGIGLMIFLGFTAGKIGVGIGALVFFIGLGKVIIARKPKADPNAINSHNNPNNSNNIR